ncbi:nuclear transport factor 2 family protein [Rhizobium lusitanum]|uniref:nuclear transport factor 2 family protein n=1 Tax=Rhizobium lusitanum TaxID=293958 RepID=UPI00160EDBDC|nr:nuclear transport factor 2 family protein [Rhizobium lusitanum]QND48217.1 nuclear transport factor 2 family protein [Rhizobium lusitanum]
MDDLHSHLKDLEERLFDPAVRGSRQALAELLCTEFREIGSSGRLFDLEDILTQLPADPGDTALRTLEDFHVSQLSDGIALVTYRATRTSPDKPTVRSLRSSIWRLEADGCWRMLFHQGTLTR